MNLALLSSLAICYSSFLPAFPDCNNNGIDDAQDIATCNADPACEDCNDDGRPDECGVLVDCDVRETKKLIASDVVAEGNFGSIVSVSEDTVIVGASSDDCASGTNCGSAQVHRWNGFEWVEGQKLRASDALSGASFGGAVSVSGNTAVVGALGDDRVPGGPQFGSAYVFRWNGLNWFEEQKLTASDGAANDLFGASVSVNGSTMIVGAHAKNCTAGFSCGEAYLFRFNGVSWVEQQKLTAAGVTAGDQFGISVALSGESTAIIGADGTDCSAGGTCGAAYVFHDDGNSWVEDQKLTASNAGSGDRFGHSVALRENTALIGAFFEDGKACGNCGSAYVFFHDGTSWVEEQILSASDASEFDQFGISVSLGRDTILVGAVSDDCDAGENCGAAYVFRFNGSSWEEQQKLTANDAFGGDGLGLSVSVNGTHAVAGAQLSECADESDCGAAYVFDLSGPDCNCNGIVDSCEVNSGEDGLSLSLQYVAFLLCLNGPSPASPDSCCDGFDMEPNETIDLKDFASFQRAFTGE